MEAIHLRSAAELEALRASGRLVARVHRELAGAVRPGVTTEEIDRLAEEIIRKAGARPAFKGYRGYPATVCASIDEEVVHGIPGPRKLKEGNILSLDVGVELDGFYGDMAISHPVGRVSRQARDLLEVTRDALDAGIAQARPGNRLGDISRAIQAYAEERGYSVVREYVGHGIGRNMHEPPQIPNFWEDNGSYNPRLKAGMVFAIEPMVNVGTWKTKRLKDEWTVVTRDRKLSAHFEHMVAVGDSGPEILTVTEQSEEAKRR
jgi:methionyl aminopeptidase